MEIIFQVLDNLKIQYKKTNAIGDIVLATFDFAFVEADKTIILPDEPMFSKFGEFLVAQGFIIHKIIKGDEKNQLATIFNIDSQENDENPASTVQPTN